MAESDRTSWDLLVIGAGSGGLATAKRAASYGARAAVIESDRVGGTCVIRGCVPKKLMVYAGGVGDILRDAAGFGWKVEGFEHDWGELVRRRNEVVDRLESVHERLLGEAGVELIRGEARVVGPNTVQVGEERLEAGMILVATGGAPVLPSIPGIELAGSSDDFFDSVERPDRVVLVGGGYIACEFAGFLSSLGCNVEMFFRAELPLRGFDRELREEMLTALQRGGVKVHSGDTPVALTRSNAGVLVETTAGASIEASKVVLFATGRRPRTRGLGLEEVGVEIGPGGEVVSDEAGHTAVDSIFAVGDVTGRIALTPVAIQAGRAIADRKFGKIDTPFDYENIPTAVFSSPPIGTVGLTEEQAVEQYGEDGVTCYRSRFRPMRHMMTGREEQTVIKLVVRRSEDERVLGCHILGEDAPEIIQGFAVAVRMGATKADFDATVGIHPSTAEELVTLR